MTTPFSWDLPSDALEVSDFQLSWRMDAPEGAVATATTRIGESETAVLIARARGTEGSGFVVGLKPVEWRLTETFPALDHPALEGLTFENIALVISERDIRVKSSELADAARDFYAKVYAADQFELVLTPGVNLIAAFPAERIGKDHVLNRLFDRLGIDSGSVLIQGTLGRSLLSLGSGAGAAAILKDVYLRASLPKMRPPESPAWFKSGQLALEITGVPSIGFVGELTVDIDGDVLLFSVAAKIEKDGAGAAVALVGGLKAEEPWVHPFDLGWLVLFRTVLKLSINTIGSVGLGFAARMIIGEKDLDVAIGLKVNASGVITNFLFDGESHEGISLADLVALQSGMQAGRKLLPGKPASPGIPLDQLPPMEIRDIHLKFALRDDADLEVERGLAARGELFVAMRAGGGMTNFAGVDFSISDSGIVAKAHLGAWSLGPVSWDDALLDLELTMERQNLIVRGAADLGFVRQDLDVSITRKGAYFSTATTLAGRFKTSLDGAMPFTVDNPVWTVKGELDNDFNGEVANLVLGRLRAWAEDHERAAAAARAAALAAREESRKAAQRLAALEAELGRRETEARNNLASVERRAAAAEKAAKRAEAALESAQARLQATPVMQVKTKAERAAAVVKARTDLAGRNAALAGLQVELAAARAVSAALSSDAIDKARQLATAAAAAASAAAAALAGLSAMAERIRSGQGTPIVVDRASFEGRLDALAGGSVDLALALRFLDRPFSLSVAWDFHRLENGIGRIVEALLDRS